MPAAEKTFFQAPWIEEGSLRLLPESERTLKRIVIGTRDSQSSSFTVPEGWAKDQPQRKQWLEDIRQELHDINFELLHGNVLSVVPKYSVFFVAIAELKKGDNSVSEESNRLHAYARRRAGWSAQECKERLRFFSIPDVLNFSQDIAEPLGWDKKGRLVFGQGDDIDSEYSHSLQALCRAYPQEFAWRDMGFINTEGGDLEIIWLPEGSVGLLLGHHRVLRWLSKRAYSGTEQHVIPAMDIGKARVTFAKAFFQSEVLILGENALTAPDLAVDELFHADMVVNIVRNSKSVMAFIPTYQQIPIDATTNQPLPPGMRERLQGFYDRSASQFQSRGYEVVRLPFADHPVRSPVNVGKFTHAETGQQNVILGKYPYHLKTSDGTPPPQETIQRLLEKLPKSLEKMRLTPSLEAYGELKQSFAQIWKAFDGTIAGSNPTFDRQVEIYRSHGINVIPVTLYPIGEGGMHCLLLN
jgi:hypothetical protein